MTLTFIFYCPLSLICNVFLVWTRNTTVYCFEIQSKRFIMSMVRGDDKCPWSTAVLKGRYKLLSIVFVCCPYSRLTGISRISVLELTGQWFYIAIVSHIARITTINSIGISSSNSQRHENSLQLV